MKSNFLRLLIISVLFFNYSFCQEEEKEVKLFSDFQFDLVFMDIEGSEYFAMNGMPNILSICNTLITEFLPHHLDRVGGITVNNFLEPLKDFKTMFIPSLNLLVQSDAFEVVLHNMCTEGVGDDGIIFYKSKMISSPNN